MGLIAPVLMGIVLFYWLAFCFTIWAWFQAIVHLCQLQFVRASLWFNAGTWMLFWWFDRPHDWDSFMPGACFFVGLGALGTFVRYDLKRKRSATDAASQFGRPLGGDNNHPTLWQPRSNEQIFGVNGQILGRDQSN
jgi:hypothetical protein